MSELKIIPEFYVPLERTEDSFDAVLIGRSDRFPLDQPVRVHSLLFRYSLGRLDEPEIQVPYAEAYLLDGSFSVQHWEGGHIAASAIPEDVRRRLVRQRPELERWLA